MKKKHLLIYIIIFFVLVLTPLLSIPIVAMSYAPQYDKTYYAALSKQYDRLNSINEEKVILIGGSNIAFGMDSELFFELYHKPIVSFGLYGSFGTKVMLDLSKTNINKGDIIIIAPEVSKESTSLYFGKESMLKATEERPDILMKIGFDNYKDVIGAFYDFSLTKIDNKRNNIVFDLSNVYSNNSVNEYGEIGEDLFPREGNILPTGFLNNIVEYNKNDIEKDFIEYVNKYVKYCNKLGATVYYSFSPVNERAINPNTFKSDIEEYYKFLFDNLDCDIISDPVDYIYDYRYFYDTNFHLNDKGKILRTVQLVKDLKLKDGDTTKLDYILPTPPEPIYQGRDIDFTLNYTDSNLFLYEEDENGFLSIVGYKNEVKELEEIILPVIHDNKYIISLSTTSLNNLSNLKKVTVPVGYSFIDNGAFLGCSSLNYIYILEKSEANISVSDNLLKGAPTTLKIVIVNGKLSEFKTGYFWSRYSDNLVKEE